MEQPISPAFVPFFLPSSCGALHALYLPQSIPALRGTLLWLPPFAEEANCARRHIVAAARECQSLGYASLLIDPFGTGESDGEFVDANWVMWRSNVIEAASWLRKQHEVPVWLVGVRSGALLAADVVSEVVPAGMVCWQPASAGRVVLDHFLRMKLASEWKQSEASTATDILGCLREQLAAGAAVEVAGYELSAAMATSLAERTLSWSVQSCARFACIEFRTHIENPSAAQHTPAVARLCDGFRSTGMQVASTVCEAPPFWQLHEAARTPGLGRKTVALLEGFVDV